MLGLLISDLRSSPGESQKECEMFTDCLNKGINFAYKLSHSFKFRF